MANDTSRPVRTRFAPSPTGSLHIGGVRTALFSWLIARHHNGKFVLRIEDTDQKRFVPGSLEQIMNGLKWLGINWDEGPDIGGTYGPYVQSKRLELYQQWAQWLVDNDKAYHCYCTSERLAQVNEEKKARKEPSGYDRHCRNLDPAEIATNKKNGIASVVRLKMPLDGVTVAHDLVQGAVEFENSTLQDIVLLKSDGYPTYHLAHVIDDHFMEISHITRANEWLPSLPIHIQLWDAFGWEKPLYAHLPVLLNPNGKGKMGKRPKSEDNKIVPILANEFQELGYLPEAVVNFLTNIGWNFGDEREVFDIDEAIERFEISQINPANSAYPVEKLDWLNGVYIREKLSSEQLAERLRAPLETAGLAVDDDLLKKVAPLVQTRIKTLNDVVDIAGFFFREQFIPPEPEILIQKKMDIDETIQILSKTQETLAELDDFTAEAIHTKMLIVVEELGLKNGQVFGTLRAAVTGQRVSTPTFETMEILGKDETIKRLSQAADILRRAGITT